MTTTPRWRLGIAVGLGVSASAVINAWRVSRSAHPPTTARGLGNQGVHYLPIGELRLVEHSRPSPDERWSPYPSHRGFRRSWWDRKFPTEPRYSLWSGFADDVEVVRMQLDERFDYLRYTDVPDLGHRVVGIEYIEVVDQLKGAGYGRRSLELLAEREFRGHWLVASAKEPAPFWRDALRWAPYQARDSRLADWPLFVAPRGWPHHG